MPRKRTNFKKELLITRAKCHIEGSQERRVTTDRLDLVIVRFKDSDCVRRAPRREVRTGG